MKRLSIRHLKFEYIFASWISLLPLIFTLGYYEAIKVFWFFLGGIFLIIPILFKKLEKLRLNLTDFLYLFWVLILYIASYFGIDFLGSVRGGAYRHQGVIFFLLLFLIKKVIEYLEIEPKKYLIYGLSFSVLVESILIIYQKIFGVTYFGNPLGTFGDVNACAGFLIIGFVLVMLFLNRRKIVIGVGVLTIVALIFLHTATSVASAFLVGAMIFVYISKRKKLAVLISLILVVMGTFFVLVLRENKFSPYENRTNLWFLGSKMFLKRPVLGYGPETTDLVYMEAFREINMPLSGLVYDRSHNLILDLFLWCGIVGASAFFIWLGSEFLRLWQNKGKLLAIIIWLGFSFYHPLGVVHWVLLMILLSL